MAWEIENNSAAVAPQWEIENNTQPMTQSVMDAENQQMYNVPLGMDGRDAQFAIDTQHKGLSKASFFGKAKMMTDAAGEAIEDVFNDVNRGVVEHVGQLADTFIEKSYSYQKRQKLLEAWQSGDWSHFGNKELTDEEKQGYIDRQKEKIELIKKMRERTKSFFSKGAEILRPTEQMDSIDEFMVGVGGAAVSVAETAAAAVATKNPTVAAGIISSVYAAMRDTEYFDKALAAGQDAETASFDAAIAGSIEGGIEFVGDKLLLSVGKIKPIQELGKGVISSAAVKLAKSKLGQSALKKIGSRHTDSIFAATVKGFMSEGGEELAQQAGGMLFENATDVSNYGFDEILSQSLWSFAVGGVSGAGMGVVGTSVYNNRVKETNDKIKNFLKEQTPELTSDELQTTADAVQEVLFQSAPVYESELNELLRRENDSDVMPEGLTPESLTAETRKLLKEKYEMTDEDIDKTIRGTLNLIDARNQFNEVYTAYRDALEMAGRSTQAADGEARLLAARAITVAKNSNVTAAEVMKRWNLQFAQQNFADFEKGVPPVNRYAQSQVHVDNIMRLVPEAYSEAEKKAIRRGFEERARYGDLKAENFNEETAKRWFEGKTASDVIRALNKRVAAVSGVLNGKDTLSKVKNSKKINPDNINPFEALVNPKLLRGVKRFDKGKSLLAFLKGRGGLKDVGGELKAMDADKQYIGLINNKGGNSLDDEALAAWENGYFPNTEERPSINDLLDAIQDELFGNKHYQYQEGENMTIVDYVDSLREQFDMLGIDYSNMTAAEAEQAYNEAADRYSEQYIDEDSRWNYQEAANSNKQRYLKDGSDKIYDNVIAIHEQAGLIENAPERFAGTTKEEIKKALNAGEDGTARVKSPIEDIKIKEEHFEHLLNDNEPQRKTFLNYVVATIERPNLIVKVGKKNHYIKFFIDNSKVKPHLQIVKVASDGSFYVTNYRPKKKQVNNTIKDGQIIYDLSAVRDNEKSLSAINNVTQPDDNVNNTLYQSAFAGSRVDYDAPSLEAIGSGEGAQAHGWGLYYALNRDVAERYREAFLGSQKSSLTIQGKSLGDYLEGLTGFIGYYDGALLLLETNPDMNPKEYFIKALNDYISDSKQYYQRYSAEQFKAAYEKAETIREKAKTLNDSDFVIKQWGQVHEVDLPENPYLLDEQKSFDEQSDLVKQGILSAIDSLNLTEEEKQSCKDRVQNKSVDGKEIYEALIPMVAKSKDRSLVYSSKEIKPLVSKLLAEFGVKGITYDGRQDGRCFVIFNPADVKVIQKFYQEQSGNNPRGAYKNGLIYLFEHADASTVIHELGHFFLDDMRKFSDDEATVQQLEAIYAYLGSEDGNLTTEQHEYFANSFEVYLLEGRAPNQLLGKVFARFKKWLRSMWVEVRRLQGVKLSDEMRKTFDDMLGGKSLDFTMQMSSLKMAEAAESGNISADTVNYALTLLKAGKISRADLDSILERLKTGELKRKDVYKELKTLDAAGKEHHEALNPFDTLKYREALQRGNINKRDVIEKINRLLEWSAPREQNGRTIGRFTNKQTNDFFDAVRADMLLSKEDAKKALATNKGIITAILQSKEIPEIERNKILGMPVNETDRASLMNLLALENRILSIPAKSSDLKSVIKLYGDLSDSYNVGRLTANVTGELKKARRNKMLQEVKDVLTDNGDIDYHKENSEVKKFLHRLGQSQYSWGGLMDLLSMNDKSSTTNKSKLSKIMDVFEQEQAEARGIADDGEKISKYMADALKGSGNDIIAASKYINNEIKKKVKVEWNAGSKTFTKDQLLDIYMKAKDEETRKIMLDDKINAYNEDFLRAVGMELNAQDRAVAQALFDFYNDNYAKINNFYEEKYGVSMPHNPYYSPRSMIRSGINVEDGSMAFAAAGFTKNRTAKAGAVDIKGAFATWNKYVAQTNHWLAWSDKLVDINSIFGDTEVKKIIENQFGSSTNNRIKTEITNMAGSKVPDGRWYVYDKVRSNFAKSVLSVKPSLMIKQLTSFPAYLEYMSVADFSLGISDFFLHMREAINTLGNTTLMKTRGVDIIRDFAELSKLDVLKGKKGIKLSDLMMLNIRLGDRGAIYAGGWALYKAELKKNLKAGMSEKEAKAKALETFERVTDETQQSGRISQQSYWQSNPFLRAFTMFMSSQNQYLRKEINAVRGMATGRMSVKQGLKTLFIFHVLLPCLFQYAADGFEWDKKAQLKAGVLGSVNGFFIVANILSNIWDAAAGQAKSKHMMIKDVLQGYGSIEDLINAFMKLADEEYEFEDVYSVLKEFGKPVGELNGVPVKYALDLFENAGDYAENDEYKKELLLWLGWSPYALRDKDE
ncbi:MAG: hypothetical protein IJ545_04685 [Alphaproteobacteria bacterium]|nr:hypothetical protein [Alphaproteobacteria bacterium]